ncbi:MAG TPA: YdeI/OmpD-associated family protein [Candidatus Limnocylindrales bacterium]
MPDPHDLPIVLFASRESFEAWLGQQGGASSGLWLKIARKGTRPGTVTYAEALDAALCFGWIDGQKRPLDDEHWLQRFTPRAARSRWSQANRKRATELIELGQMRHAGLAEVERAKADGRWDAAYQGARSATVPDDLQAALDADAEAAAFFATLDSRNRYAILYRIGDAKRPETRRARIETYVAMCREHKLIHP